MTKENPVDKTGEKYENRQKEIQLTELERNRSLSKVLTLQTSLSHSVGLKWPKIFVLVDKKQRDE